MVDPGHILLLFWLVMYVGTGIHILPIIYIMLNRGFPNSYIHIVTSISVNSQDNGEFHSRYHK